MRPNRVRLYFAGLVAFLLGFPLSEGVLAGTLDVVGASIDLGLAIADSAGNS